MCVLYACVVDATLSFYSCLATWASERRRSERPRILRHSHIFVISCLFFLFLLVFFLPTGLTHILRGNQFFIVLHYIKSRFAGTHHAVLVYLHRCLRTLRFASFPLWRIEQLLPMTTNFFTRCVSRPYFLASVFKCVALCRHTATHIYFFVDERYGLLHFHSELEAH
jgi:hypothetical protein